MNVFVFSSIRNVGQRPFSCTDQSARLIRKGTIMQGTPKLDEWLCRKRAVDGRACGLVARML
jgi:hypothetical protein